VEAIARKYRLYYSCGRVGTQGIAFDRVDLGSAPEIGSLIEASEKVCASRSRKSHALTIVRARAESQLIDFGGERGTRTLDLGIMSATL
jgi:hypothetical protein